jgi:hypothetical protein
VRRELEEERIATLRDHPEPPDGESSAEKARRLWIPRAFQQTSYVSHMAREICDESTKANWSAWPYREYRRLLDEEMMTVSRIYAEVELADLPVREGKEAKGWLTSAHQDAERAREHTGGCVKKKEELMALLHPLKSSSSRSQGSVVRSRAFLAAKGVNRRSQKQARDAADRARLQANKTPEASTEFPGNERGEVSFARPRNRNEETVVQGTFVGGLTGAAQRQAGRHSVIIAWTRGTMSPTSMDQLMQDTKRSKRPQVASEAAERATRLPEGTRNGRRGNPACPHALDRADVDLVDSTSESDNFRPGRNAAAFQRSRGFGRLPTKSAAHAATPTSDHTRVRPKANGGRQAPKENRRTNGKVRSEVAVHGAEELPTADVRRESPGFRLPQGARAGSSSMEAGDGDARAPAPDQPPGESDGFARELASTMSAIASLVIKASGRSVSNGGWLYFNGASEDYHTFRAKCRLFQETYHKATPPMALVKMFREWNLAEDVACRIEGAEDMPAAWRTLDSIYGAPLTLTTDQTPEAGWMPEPREVESGMGSEAGPTSEEEPAPLQARGAAAFRIVDIDFRIVDIETARPAVEAAISPQGKHVFINTPHGIRSLRRLWVRSEEPEHTVVSKEVAQRYSMRADSRGQATWITGPTGVTVGIDTDYEMFLLVDDLPGRTKRIFAYAVNSVEEYCGLPTGATDEYEIQLGRDHVELLEQLGEAQPYRTGARLSERWGETIWRLAAYAESGEHVWINVIRSYQQEESEITLATSRRLGCNEPGEGCLVAVHMRAGMCPITEGPIRAWTVEAIGKLEPGDSPHGNAKIRWWKARTC